MDPRPTSMRLTFIIFIMLLIRLVFTFLSINLLVEFLGFQFIVFCHYQKLLYSTMQIYQVNILSFFYQVMTHCNTIPSFTPIATFTFGSYALDSSSMSAIFIECSGKGIKICCKNLQDTNNLFMCQTVIVIKSSCRYKYSVRSLSDTDCILVSLKQIP